MMKMRFPGTLWLMVTFVALMASHPSAWGQSTYSPYSRFGLGQLQSGAGIAQMGMGQMGAAWTDRSHLNTINPAAAAFLTRTTFAGGFHLRSERISEGDSTTFGDVGGLTQVAFALKRAGGKTAISFGLQPSSSAGYELGQRLSDPVAEEYEVRYSGSGGLTRSYFGISRRWEGTSWRYFNDKEGNVVDSVRIITSGTALGGRFEQVFGTMVRTRVIDISNPIFVDTRVQTEEVHRNAGFTLGLIREQLMGARFNPDKKLTSSSLLRLGAVMRLGRNHTNNRDTQWSSYQTLSTGPLEVDSVHSTGETFDLELPMELIVGLEWEMNTAKGARWRAGLEMRRARWAGLSSDMLDPGVLWVDDDGFSAGISLTPRGLDDARNGWERSTFSLGYRQQTGYIEVNQGRVESGSWSLGWSLPMLGSRSGSSFNMAFLWQNTATDPASGVREQSTGAMFGFTLHPFFKNQWLVPRRYD